MEAVVILNPSAGRGTTPAEASRRLAAAGLTADLRVTTRAGEASTLARDAVAGGARLVIAWGGDGTIHETATALIDVDADLGIVPAGSGNGLARGLGISLDPGAALRGIVTGGVRRIDVGEMASLPFFNVAGAGLDAWVAARTQEVRAAGWPELRGESRQPRPSGRRGLLPYVRSMVRGLFTLEPWPVTLETPGQVLETRALLVAFANGPQYGHGARIVPGARFDDGLLDIVVIEGRAALAALWQSRQLFRGSITTAPGVQLLRCAEARLRSERPIPLHRDGEAAEPAQDVQVRVRPAALRVRAVADPSR